MALLNAIFWISLISAILSAILVLLKILEKSPEIIKKYSNKPEIKIMIPNFAFGSRIRTEEEKNESKSFSYKFPKIIPTLSIEIHLTNYSKEKNVITLGLYMETKAGKRINFFYKTNTSLEPMNPRIFKWNNIKLNWHNEMSFWEERDLSNKTNNELNELFWKLAPRYICISIEDAYNKKVVKKLNFLD